MGRRNNQMIHAEEPGVLFADVGVGDTVYGILWDEDRKMPYSEEYSYIRGAVVEYLVTKIEMVAETKELNQPWKRTYIVELDFAGSTGDHTYFYEPIDYDDFRRNTMWLTKDREEAIRVVQKAHDENAEVAKKELAEYIKKHDYTLEYAKKPVQVFKGEVPYDF